MDPSDTIDARGLLCPLPVLKLRKRLKSVASGEIIELWADDPAAIVDVPHFCVEAGHELISQDQAQDYAIYRVRKQGG
ncbi:MAG: sulfurtransferase TusA family protein [Pseudomonadota bacterium]